jgi:hypothetical protein
MRVTKVMLATFALAATAALLVGCVGALGHGAYLALTGRVARSGKRQPGELGRGRAAPADRA